MLTKCFYQFLSLIFGKFITRIYKKHKLLQTGFKRPNNIQH